MNENLRRKPHIIGRLFLLIVVTALFFATFRQYYRNAYPVRYAESVYAYSKRNDLPPALVFAVIRTESGFRPEAESSVGARGLMQLTEETFDWVKYRTGKTGDDYAELYDPERNIEYGAALLRLLVDEFGSVENALCAYHAGWGNAKKWLDNPDYSGDGLNIHNIPFGDTRRYVKKVVSTWEIYKSFYNID